MPDNYFFSPTAPMENENVSEINESNKYDNGRGGQKNDKFLTPWQQFEE